MSTHNGHQFKLALVQMSVEAGNRAHNLQHAARLVAEVAAQGADIAVLPEAMDLGWTHPSATTGAGSIPAGGACQALRNMARQHRVFVCAGLTERAGDQVFNSAVVIDRRGELLLLHRKLNELEIGHPFYGQGDRLGVCHTELGTLGLLICADAFARDRVLSRALGYMGADLILSPSAWAVPPDHDNQTDPYGQTWRDAYVPVAQEFSLWMIGVSCVGPITAGPWAGWNCIGCSLAIDPKGDEVVQGPYGVDAETILYVDVTTVSRPARGDGWRRHWEESSQPHKAARAGQ